jgi:hypothetical protein
MLGEAGSMDMQLLMVVIVVLLGTVAIVKINEAWPSDLGRSARSPVTNSSLRQPRRSTASSRRHRQLVMSAGRRGANGRMERVKSCSWDG